MPDKLSDDHLLQRLRKGDDNAFDALYLRYFEVLWHHAYRITRSKELAEEIVQDVFLALWSRRQEWQIQEALDRYLFSSVRNTAVRRLQRDSRFIDAVKTLRIDSADIHAESSPPADDLLILAELDQTLRQVLIDMPRIRRQVALLRWQYGLSFAEVGETLGISAAAAKVQAHRARNALRAALSGMKDTA